MTRTRFLHFFLCLFCACLLCSLAACSFGSNSPPAVATYPVTPSPTVNVPFVNIRVSRDQYPAHVQPSLAVNPRNQQNLLGTAEVEDANGDGHDVTFASFDGGSTWQDNGPLPMPAGYLNGQESVIAFSASGIGFVAAMIRQNQSNNALSRIVVWRTSDGGKTFGQPLTVTQGASLDFPSIAIDMTRGPFAGNVYLAWDDNNSNSIDFSRSSDGGQSFAAPNVVADSQHGGAVFPVVTVAPSGTVHMLYAIPTNRFGQNVPLAMIDSSDGGSSFDAPHTIKGTSASFFVGTERVFSLLASAVDPRSGTLYIAYSTPRPYSENLDVMLMRSTNDGRTWSRPIQVDNDPLTNLSDHFQPQLAITPNGVLCVSYFTLTNDNVDVFLTQSTDQGVSFQRSQRVDKVSWSQYSGVNGQWIGDYQGLAVTSTMAFPFWNDGRTGNLEIFTAPVPVQ